MILVIYIGFPVVEMRESLLRRNRNRKKSVHEIKNVYLRVTKIWMRYVYLLQNRRIMVKEMSFCDKLRFSYCYIVLIQCWWPLIFQIMNSVRSNILSLKSPRFKPSGCRDIGIITFKFVGKTQLLWKQNLATKY